MSRESFGGSRSYESDSEKGRYSGGYFGEAKGEKGHSAKKEK